MKFGSFVCLLRMNESFLLCIPGNGTQTVYRVMDKDGAVYIHSCERDFLECCTLAHSDLGFI